MAVGDINAQASFDSLMSEYTSYGYSVITDLQNRLDDAVDALTTISWLDLSSTGDFASLDLASTTSPFVSGGTNVLHSQIIDNISTAATFGDSNARTEAHFARLKERESTNLRKAMDTSARAYMTSGFSHPTGPANAMMSMLQHESRDRLLAAHREYTEKTVDMYQDQKQEALAAALGVEKQNVEAFKAHLDRILKSLDIKLEQFKAQVHEQVGIAAAAMSGLNINIGLSIAGRASVGGDERKSESSDLTATVNRHSINHHVNSSTSESVNYSTSTSNYVDGT